MMEARNDPGTLRAIYDRCSGRALALALRILKARADAEEVIQEAFLEVWKRAQEFDPRRGGIEAWVLTITRSRAIDRLRSQGAGARLKDASYHPHGDLAITPPDAAEQRQERERVAEALAALPMEQRRVVELAYFEGLSQRQIAEKTGDPLGTVKTRVRLGMEKLAALLDQPEAQAK